VKRSKKQKWQPPANVNFLEELLTIQKYLIRDPNALSKAEHKAAKRAYNTIIATIFGPDDKAIVLKKIAAPCLTERIKFVNI